MSMQPVPIDVVHMVERHLLLNATAPDGALYALIGEVYALGWNQGIACQTAVQVGQKSREVEA